MPSPSPSTVTAAMAPRRFFPATQESCSSIRDALAANADVMSERTSQLVSSALDSVSTSLAAGRGDDALDSAVVALCKEIAQLTADIRAADDARPSQATQTPKPPSGLSPRQSVTQMMGGDPATGSSSNSHAWNLVKAAQQAGRTAQAFGGARDGQTGGALASVLLRPADYTSQREVVITAAGPLGFSLADRFLEGQHDSVVVTNVAPGLPAAMSGVREGDVLVKVNGQPAKTQANAVAAIRAAGRPLHALKLVLCSPSFKDVLGSDPIRSGDGVDDSAAAGREEEEQPPLLSEASLQREISLGTVGMLLQKGNIAKSPSRPMSQLTEANEAAEINISDVPSAKPKKTSIFGGLGTRSSVNGNLGSIKQQETTTVPSPPPGWEGEWPPPPPPIPKPPPVGMVGPWKPPPAAPTEVQ